KDLVLCNTELNPFTNIFCPTFGVQFRSLVSFIQQSRPLMEQKDLNSCYKKRINFELSPKVDPLTI
ncbi:hypothetical protein ABQD49_05490, partial [Lactococcus petauri]|uniref:hypothetical protein n=1 Tax=Lactococcus petauri TaxID=1940789 RepID=UPI0032E39FE4